MDTVLLSPVSLFAVLVWAFISGLQLKFACWAFNHFFAGEAVVAEAAEDVALPVPVDQTSEEFVVADTVEQEANPFSSPRQIAKPDNRTRTQVVVEPTFGVAFGLGVLLTGLQVVVLMLACAGTLIMFSTRFGLLANLFCLFGGGAVLLAATTVLVSALLSNNYPRGLAVACIYYASMLLIAFPLIVIAMVG